jgi:hypothetical protein
LLTALDAFVDEMAIRIGRLSKRSQIALFWACSSGLLPEYIRWATYVDARTEPILNASLVAAYQFAALGQEPSGKQELLSLLEASAPPGDSAGKTDEANETAAQDCWICADVCIRVLVEEDYDAGPVIEYALEPILQHATEYLFGVSQVGSGPHEVEQVQAILAQHEVSRATDFIQWALDLLNDPSPLSESGLQLIRERAAVLQPGQ